MDFLASLTTFEDKQYDFPCSQIIMKGPDAIDFLQKMTTNDLRKLSLDNYISTVFVDAHGKIIDRVWAFLLEHEKVLLVSSNLNAQVLFDWIDKFHFIEDFVVSMEKKYSIKVSFSAHPTKEALKKAKLFEIGALSAQLLVSEKSFSQQKITDDEWEALRITAGFPSFPYEINNSFMPQNVGLMGDIALNKGCFIGQEVIAKAITYQKKPLKFFAIKPSLHEYEALKKTSLIITKELLGKVTSISPCYIPNNINALAVLRKNDSEEPNFTDDIVFECDA